MESLTGDSCVKFIFPTLGMTVLGGVGWWLGEQWNLFAAVVLSAVGTGVGMYYGRKLFDEWLG
jgi:hypothetical protein